MPDRWQRIEQLYHSALKVEEAQRAAFLQDTCGGDETLRREVESLLADDKQAETFLESPAFELAAKAIAVERTALYSSVSDDLHLIGQTISHYRVMEKLGGGGMGVVYKAEDLKLGRFVALKFLPEELLHDPRAVQQLRSEARAASALNHPHICTVHDTDEYEARPFIVMEMLEGQTLKGHMRSKSLDNREIAGLAVQITDALEAAHAKGIIHRDIKPANIFITARSEVKVLDFGLAKLLPSSLDSTLTASLAETRAFVGTLPYMAPEQLQARGTDARTDIFALGVVLYEMATGQRPFQEEVPARLVDEILHKQPLTPRRIKPTTSRELEHTILRCLQKDPANRYQSATELKTDLARITTSPKRGYVRTLPMLAAAILLVLSLAWVMLEWRTSQSAGTADIRSVAVLPLANLSGDPQQEYLADGVTEELITDLAKLGSLKVISRTSAMHYKGTNKTLPQIGRELNVDAIVEGSVQRFGQRLKITTQLIRAATDQHLWAEEYERDGRDVLTIEGAVARDIANEVKAKLTPEQQVQLGNARQVNPAAYESYLRGRFLMKMGTAAAFQRAIVYFQKAVEIEPGFALGYAGLADSYTNLGNFSGMSSKEAYAKAKAETQKALEIDNRLAEAHLNLAVIKHNYEYDQSSAEREFRHALELSPNLADAHAYYSFYLVHMLRCDDALAEAKIAKQLDPLSPLGSIGIGIAFVCGRHYDRAIEQFQKELDSDPLARYWLQWAYMGQGNFEAAIAENQRLPLEEGSPGVNDRGEIAVFYALAGKKQEAFKILTDLKEKRAREYIRPHVIAEIYAAMGENDQAIEWLEKSYDERDDWITSTRMFVGDLFQRPLHSDPRYQELMRRVGLPP